MIKVCRLEAYSDRETQTLEARIRAFKWLDAVKEREKNEKYARKLGKLSSKVQGIEIEAKAEAQNAQGTSSNAAESKDTAELATRTSTPEAGLEMADEADTKTDVPDINHHDLARTGQRLRSFNRMSGGRLSDILDRAPRSKGLGHVDLDSDSEPDEEEAAAGRAAEQRARDANLGVWTARGLMAVQRAVTARVGSAVHNYQPGELSDMEWSDSEGVKARKRAAEKRKQGRDKVPITTPWDDHLVQAKARGWLKQKQRGNRA